MEEVEAFKKKRHNSIDARDAKKIKDMLAGDDSDVDSEEEND